MRNFEDRAISVGLLLNYAIATITKDAVHDDDYSITLHEFHPDYLVKLSITLEKKQEDK